MWIGLKNILAIKKVFNFYNTFNNLKTFQYGNNYFEKGFFTGNSEKF